MFAKLVNLFDTPQQLRFTSPYPIEECAKRLRESIGKPIGCLAVRVKGHVEKVDAVTYEFSLYQPYRGGHKITGHLYVETESTTRIEATHTVDRSSWLSGIIFAVVLMIMMFIVQIPNGDLSTAFIISGILVAVTISIMFISAKSQHVSQLVWYFERTLKQ